MATTFKTFEQSKDPSSVLDYRMDFTNLLETAETIATQVTAINPTGELTIDSQAVVAGAKKVQLVLSAGDAGKSYTITTRITTTGGSVARTFERSALLEVKER